MSSFIGTNKAFKRHIGPSLRVLVTQLTREYRKRVGRCEHCGTESSLEAAHVHGKGRLEIIDNILSDRTHDNVVTVDLEWFEAAFRKAHEPIEESIKILCNSCHRAYDTPVVVEEAEGKHVSTEQSYSGVLPISLTPEQVDIFHTKIMETKRAEITTYFRDGSAQKDIWNANSISNSSNIMGNLRSRPKFRSGMWQSLGIEKIHVVVLPRA